MSSLLRFAYYTELHAALTIVSPVFAGTVPPALTTSRQRWFIPATICLTGRNPFGYCF